MKQIVNSVQQRHRVRSYAYIGATGLRRHRLVMVQRVLLRRRSAA